MPTESEAADRELNNAKKRVQRLDTSPRNRKDILDFASFCFAEGLSTRRVIKYMSTLCTIAKRLRKEFRKVTRADIQALVEGIERSDYSGWTKRDFRITLKKFFRWLRGTEEYPDEVKWLRTGFHDERQKLPEELLTPQEVQAMIVAARTARDKALIASLYESGCRIGELRSLRIKQLQQHSYGFQITVEGKKRPRRLLLIACAPYLTTWLNQHPRREDPNAPLWIKSDHRATQLSHARVTHILKTSAK
jgi:integrase/recombinase XerD